MLGVEAVIGAYRVDDEGLGLKAEKLVSEPNHPLESE